MTAGCRTGIDLENTGLLFRRKSNSSGDSMPVFSQTAACFALELAALSYDRDTSLFKQAGFTDFSFISDNMLLTGARANKGDRFSLLMQKLSVRKIKDKGLISQAYGALRQKGDCDTCKAVIMARVSSGGKADVFIGFMGTGTRAYDWVANLRFGTEKESHSGFKQLAERFLRLSRRITFPSVARLMNEDQLTLSDIFEKCRDHNSPYRIFMSGHSQGGAVEQNVIAALLEQGVRADRMTGYAFASPGAATARHPFCGKAFPLFHILNEDDTVPRVGGEAHLGVCMRFMPNDIIRVNCYRPCLKQPASLGAFALLSGIRDPGSAAQLMLGLLDALIRLSDDETEEALAELLRGPASGGAAALLARGSDGLMGMLRNYVNSYYHAHSSGGEISELQVAVCREAAGALIMKYGVRNVLASLADALLLPHRLYGEDEERGTAVYLSIVRDHFYLLDRALWDAGSRIPVRQRGSQRRLSAAVALPRFARGKRKCAICRETKA